MTDWSAALRRAYEHHRQTSGSSGSSGSEAEIHNGNNGVAGRVPGTTGGLRMVPVVPTSPAGTTEANAAERVVPQPPRGELQSNQTLVRHGTTGTTGTTQNDGARIDDAALDWRSGVDRLQPDDPLPGFSNGQWHALIDDGHRFLDRWTDVAFSLGWTTEDLFGVHPVAPAARYDCMGLVPLIRGGEVVDTRTDRATIRMPRGNCLVYYLRRPNPNAVPLWDLARSQPRRD